MEKKHNYTLDLLRGFASLFVVFFHFTTSSAYLLNTNILRNVGRWGYLGVEIFFVISGYIIPLSMFSSNYNIIDFKSFILKRIIRIEPPYLITIALVLILNYLSTISPFYRGVGFHFDRNLGLSIISHIGYLTELLNFKWLNPVFWTLGIEFQYYLFISVFYLILTYKLKFVRIAGVLFLFAVSSLFPDKRLLFHYLLLFTPGIICFLYTSKHISQIWLYVLIVLNLVFGYKNNGIESITACFIAFLIIYLVRLPKKKVFSFLGNVSFSLYLIHVPICMRILNLSETFIKGDVARTCFLLLLLGCSLFVAYLFYIFIEKPFLIKSKRVNSRKTFNVLAVTTT